jgi:RNA polymerase sigma-70 factor (ECF subfamily)
MEPNLSDLPDNDLVSRIARGDKLAFGSLYERYLDQIYRYVYFRVADHDEAEDLTELVFLKAWQVFSAGRNRKEVRNFRAWIYRIAHNEVVERYRTQKPTLTINHLDNLSHPDPTPEANILAIQSSQSLAQAITELEPDLQQVLVCRFINQLSHAETAKIMNLKPGHVRVLQHRALKKMGKLMSQEE